MVDVPGHEWIRDGIVDQFSSSASGIVYMVDSNTVSKQVMDVAEYLYSVLGNGTIHLSMVASCFSTKSSSKASLTISLSMKI